AERLIYADWLEEHGDAALAAVVRTAVRLRDVPEHRLWSGERTLPGVLGSEAASKGFPLDLADGVALLPLLAAVARSRPHDAAAHDLEPWFPAAADSLRLSQRAPAQGDFHGASEPGLAQGPLAWESLRNAAFARFAGDLERRGRPDAAAYVRERRSGIIWEAATELRVFWTAHPSLLAFDVASAAAHRVEDVPPGMPLAQANAGRRGTWWDRSSIIDVLYPCASLDEAERGWHAAGETLLRLANQGAIAPGQGDWRCGRSDLFELMDPRRLVEFNDAATNLLRWTHDDEARASAFLAEFVPAVYAAAEAWRIATWTRPSNDDAVDRDDSLAVGHHEPRAARLVEEDERGGVLRRVMHWLRWAE
ncbi:MAG TPA: TIGR02996 domain-containing protein, partial [Pirellulales bacterium]